jgi:D-lactate dehydrogenase (cytochrome)
VPGGFASGVAFPATAADAAALIAAAAHVLPIGAQSSLTGGATPRGDLIVGTRALTEITALPDGRMRVGAGVPLAALQRVLAASGRYYPPVPTYDGAFIGGTVATNAAGPATFKYGSARQWVDALTLVLADGSVLDLRRGQITASDGWLEIPTASRGRVRVPVPTYTMPSVPKLSAGYFAQAAMDAIDLFVGSEGTLAFVGNVTVRVVSLPRRCVALLPFESDAQAVALTAALRRKAGHDDGARPELDVSAVEFMDARALALVPDEVFAHAIVVRPPAGTGFLLAQIEADDNGDERVLEGLQQVLTECGVEEDPSVAMPGDDRGAARLFALREGVPASLNAMIAATRSRLRQDVEKTAGDMIVPFERLEESIALYRSTFDRYGLDYAIWGHVSDGNMHPNVVPRSLEDVRRGREALLEIARGVMAMGGAPLAEHGVGRSAMKQQMLRELYGEQGIEQMRAVKRALDPAWKFASGVLFPP